jgi:hypothetical protein
MGLAGGEGELATAAASPRAAGEVSRRGAPGRRGAGIGSQAEAVLAAVGLHVRRVGSVGQKQEQGTASRGGRARRDCKQRVGKGVSRAAWRKGKAQRGEE